MTLKDVNLKGLENVKRKSDRSKGGMFNILSLLGL